MNNSESIQKLIQDYLDLQKGYSFTTRTAVTAHRYSQMALSGMVDKKDYDNPVLCEPLIEHIGHLPILAAYWHPYIQNTNEVDLGKALTMLAIHDIGETVVGDINTYHKTEQNSEDEYEAALKVLHPKLHQYLDEYEARETLEAKFAKSIDAFAVESYLLSIPTIAIDRAKQLNFTAADVIEKKRNLFEWDKVLLEVFDMMMHHYTAVGKGESPVFITETYDQLH